MINIINQFALSNKFNKYGYEFTGSINNQQKEDLLDFRKNIVDQPSKTLEKYNIDKKTFVMIDDKLIFSSNDIDKPVYDMFMNCLDNVNERDKCFDNMFDFLSSDIYNIIMIKEDCYKKNIYNIDEHNESYEVTV